MASHATQSTFSTAVRLGILAVAVVAAVVAAGFILRWNWARELWPWSDGRLSYLFVGSIFAAIAAAVLWVGIANDPGMLAPGLLNLTVTFGGQAAFLFLLYSRRDDTQLLLTALVLAAAALANAFVWWRTRHAPPRDPRPLPTVARASFAFFVVVLVAAGLALLLGAEHIFPWPLNPDSAVMFGWIFLGDACFFAYGVVRPRWAYAAPQLLAFLAYDLVLMRSFLRLIDDVQPGHGLSLTLYTTMLAFSGTVAVYFLFVHRATRILFGTRQPDPRPAAAGP